MPDGAAARAGLREGDLVQRIGKQDVVDGQQLRELIRLGGEAIEGPWDGEEAIKGRALLCRRRCALRQQACVWHATTARDGRRHG